MIYEAVSPDRSVVSADDAGDCGEANAGAFEVLVPVKTVEGVEEFFSVVHVEAGAVVANEPGVLGGVPAEFDGRLRNSSGELDRVAKKIFKGDTEKF